MQLAICLWSPETSDQAIELLRAEGVRAIEPGPSFLLENDEAALKSAARRLRSAGIGIYSCHAPFGGESDISLLEDAKRKGAVAEHEKALLRAALAGAECIVIHPSGRVKEDEAPLRLDRLCASLEALLRSAERAGVRLALENMLPGHLGCDSASLRRVVDRFDSPLLGVCFDTGHVRVNDERVDAAFLCLRGRAIAFHLQDSDGCRDNHIQPPYGTVDWPAFVREFHAMEFARPVAVEAAPWNGSGWRQLLREVEAVFTDGVLTIPFKGRRVRAVCEECGHYCFVTGEGCRCACNG